MIRYLLIAFSVSLFGTAGEAAEIPRFSSWVNDYAGVLTSKDRAALEETLAAYENETTHQIAILTVASLEDESIESFSLKVANAWGLGHKRIDNGVLITLAMSEHAVRIELGTGMNRYVSNSDARGIVDSTMLPAFRRGDIAGGLKRGVERLLEACRAYKVPKPADAGKSVSRPSSNR